jgi:hypothetical protein
MNCPTCGAPVDYLDEAVLRRGESRTTRSYHYQQPLPLDLAEVRLEGVEAFVRVVQMEVATGLMTYEEAIRTNLETIRSQIRQSRRQQSDGT